jgi:NIPSNAP
MRTYHSDMTTDRPTSDDSSPLTDIRPVVEVRTYRTKPGCRTEFIEIFQSLGGPAQRAYGMTILGPLSDAEDADTVVWLRAFPADAERERIKAAFYEGPEWTDELEGIVEPLLAETTVRVCHMPAGFLDGPLRSTSWH